MHLLGRFAVNFSFGVRDALEHREGFFLHPIGERALGNQFFDLGERSVFIVVMMFVLVLVLMRMCMAMFVFVFMVMMRVSMVMVVLVVMLILQMNIKFHAGDSRFLLSRDVQVVTIHAQFFLQFLCSN